MSRWEHIRDASTLLCVEQSHYVTTALTTIRWVLTNTLDHYDCLYDMFGLYGFERTQIRLRLVFYILLCVGTPMTFASYTALVAVVCSFQFWVG